MECKRYYWVIGIFAMLLLSGCANTPNKAAPISQPVQSDNRYDDSIIRFTIPSGLETHKTNFGTSDGIIIWKAINNTPMISITISSHKLKTNQPLYSDAFFNESYNELVLAHPNIAAVQTQTIVDSTKTLNGKEMYEKSISIGGRMIFGTIVLFDQNSDSFARITYYYGTDYEPEFLGYKNAIISSLEFK